MLVILIWFGEMTIKASSDSRVVVENDKTDQAAIIKLMPGEKGDYYIVETAGYYR